MERQAGNDLLKFESKYSIQVFRSHVSRWVGLNILTKKAYKLFNLEIR